MSLDLTGIPSSGDRLDAADAAALAAPTAEEAAVTSTAAVADHIFRGIRAWCNATDAATVIKNEYKFRSTLVSSDILDTWETQLDAQGYLVSRGAKYFTIELGGGAPE